MAAEWLTEGLPEDILFFVCVIGLILGLILVFGGKLLWRPLMSIIGGFAGSIFGFALGYILGGAIGGLIGAGVGAIIGGLIFVAIAEFAVALMSGILAFVLLLIVTGNFIIGLIAGIVVFIIAAKFMDKVIGILMAIGGGLIAGASLIGLGIDIGLSAIIAIILIIMGSIIQTVVVKTKRERAAEAKKSQVPICMDCGKPLYHDQARNQWFCPDCAVPPPPPPPPANP